MPVRRFLAFFLPVVTSGALVALMVAGAVQQDLRQSADDPQHQLAEDAVARLNADATPADAVSGPKVDIARSLDPFLAV